MPGLRVRFRHRRGEKVCNYYDCPYLPAELDVFCTYCRYDFFTEEGTPPCEDPLGCPQGPEPLANVENLRRWRGRLGRMSA